jgi:hypothetical protein
MKTKLGCLGFLVFGLADISVVFLFALERHSPPSCELCDYSDASVPLPAASLLNFFRPNSLSAGWPTRKLASCPRPN